MPSAQAIAVRVPCRSKEFPSEKQLSRPMDAQLCGSKEQQANYNLCIISMNTCGIIIIVPYLVSHSMASAIDLEMILRL